ncbi:sugar phosphate isomerase/epimerase family protein [Allonocardiopsis opalescens]|uniref:Sugar phosphate isomerase/epimerase n=1 Tax=Allonocardiopsis opalescens TaxID=1144618 RepID=A0A2T0Q1S8_9ACTN|nr:TIM barrel protein [Allonocardiopsis opalescens]PRX97756.1 sugar phosphate isomerase/epimerase [Allonocardiopsis opalescens]
MATTADGVRPGLASVTFRTLPPDEVVRLAERAGVRVIEWAGDTHVPAGDLDRARAVRKACADTGIEPSTYGSYYKAGHSDPDAFEPAVAAAAELGAPRIRVWAGTRGSAEADTAQRGRVVGDLARCAALAEQAGLDLTVEYHVESLTDDLDSAARLYREVGAPNLVAHWQPRELPDTAACLAEVGALLPRLRTVHVFSWGADGYTERLPLAARADLWRPVLAALAADGAPRDALLEFVPDDSPEAFVRDAAALRDWIAEVG